MVPWNAHINWSSDPIGCTYQASDPGGCTYQFSDPEGCIYQSRDPEGYTYQSRDPEEYTYQSSDPEGHYACKGDRLGKTAWLDLARLGSARLDGLVQVRLSSASSTQLSRLGGADPVSTRQWQHEHTTSTTKKTARLPLLMTRRTAADTTRSRQREPMVGRVRGMKKKNSWRRAVVGCLRVAKAPLTTYEAETEAVVRGALNGRGKENGGADSETERKRR
ncbi:NBS-LRR type resistance protein [Cucumis melo var. makuwa]|uniref:NBS-LRR type resistance protein n=1 Tax=Cucumis melo var. makuwa TaxID=1194695 RepID=A0A5A7V797_CUCMM|nr:NBS-LRR type resistance protein [Cucumis melo var. makuwa]TYK18612.1 NBS-LRR type resistance protein [Cucumis melo var. makuwa]